MEDSECSAKQGAQSECSAWNSIGTSDVSSARVSHKLLQIHSLPQPLISKILDSLDTESRINASIVSKGWRDLVAQSWSSIQMTCGPLLQLVACEAWLAKIAGGRPEAIRSFLLELREGHFSLDLDLQSLCIDQFIHLESLSVRLQNVGTPFGCWAFDDTKLEFLRPLKKLEELDIVYWPDHHQREVVTLQKLSMFTSLRYLSLVLRKVELREGANDGWNIQMHSALTGLSQLQALRVTQARSVLASPALHDIFGRLTHLSLSISGMLAELVGIPAPNLEELIYAARDCSLPCSGLERLQELHVRQEEVEYKTDWDLSIWQGIQLHGLQQLVLHLDSRTLTEADFLVTMRCIQNMRHLEMVNLAPYYGMALEEQGHEVFAPFRGLKRLKRIGIELAFPYDDEEHESATISLRPSILAQLKHLTSLTVSKRRQYAKQLAIHLESGLKHLQSLQNLTLQLQGLSTILASTSLTFLKLDMCPPPLHVTVIKFYLFRNFPRLKGLELLDLKSLEDCLHVVAMLRNMPCLGALVLTTRCKRARSLEEGPAEFEAEAALLEELLLSLKQQCMALPSLNSVHLVSLESEIILSRRLLPAVQQFALICGGLAVDDSFFSLPAPELYLAALRMFGNTKRVLGDTLRLRSLRWRANHWRATNFHKDSYALFNLDSMTEVAFLQEW